MTREPALHLENERRRAVLVWEWEQPVSMLSSAAVGGGLVAAPWLVNIGVPKSYARTDLEAHVKEIAAEFELTGHGVGLFTAADVSRVERAEVEAVVVDTTVGISNPTWAADPGARVGLGEPGTINIVIQLPVALDPAAAVNAVVTATEAKSQALLEAGVDGTGTASDAIVICWPQEAAGERFAGPRSPWGSRIALATHAAVSMGIHRWS